MSGRSNETGRVLDVRHITNDDRDLVRSWRNNERVREVSVNDQPVSPDAHSRWFESVVSSRSEEFRIVMSHGSPFGIVRLDRCEAMNDVWTWSCNSGEATLTPGVGACLPVIAIALGFECFQARRLVADVLSTNKNMRGIHRRLGIEQEGVRRAHIERCDGAQLDILEYGILRSEWQPIFSRALAMLPSAVAKDLQSVVTSLSA